MSVPRHTIAQYLNVRGAGPGAPSPDGSRLLLLWAVTGTPQLWLLEGPRGWPRQITFFPDRVNLGHWSPDGERIAFTTDVGGNERDQIFTVRPDGSDLRRLTHNDAAIHRLGDFHPGGAALAYAANDRNGRDFDLYRLDSETGEARRLRELDGWNTPLFFTPDGKRLLYDHANTNVDNDLLLVDVETEETELLTPHAGDALFEAAGFTPDGRSLYVATNRDREFVNRARIELETKALRFLADEDADTDAFTLSRDGRTLAWVVNRDGWGDLHVADAHTGRRIGVEHLRRGVTHGVCFAHDAPCLSVSVTAPTAPVTTWRVDLRAEMDPAQERPVRAVPWTEPSFAGIAPDALVTPELVRYPSFDGLSIPAFLYVPRGAKADGSLPVVMDIHGGPESQERPDFNPVIQYLVHRGYGVLAPNIRGSTGYGKAYTHKDDVHKRPDAIADVAAGADWLAASGWADRGKIAILGGSYGGYATLAALAFHPERWAAGVSIVGISNLLTFLQNTGAYRRALRISEYGDPERDAEFLRSVSPFYFVDRIRAPLLVIQGANDPRVPQSESDQIVAAIKERNGTVDYLLFPDEGHGVVKLPNRIACWGRVADFLDAHLGAPEAAG